MPKSLRFLILFVSLSACSGWCQHPERASASPTYLSSAFDIEQKQLPKGFKGHSAERIYEALSHRKATAQKSEFESQAEYQQRMAHISEQAFMPSLHPADIFAFLSSHLIVSYDAEKKQLEMQNPFTRDPNNEAQFDGLEAPWSESIAQKGSYLAQNRFGAVWRIRREVITQYDLFTTDPAWNTNTMFVDPPLTLPMSPLKAKAIKGSLRALVVCSLAPPFVGRSSRSFDEATLHEPLDRTFVIHNLYVDVREIWIVNPSSGEILGRFDKGNHEIKLRSGGIDE